jgi:2-polyprenyl-6-methoxyphenol hydroxylase-like FAD-dependent oxidoreductase
MAALAAGGLVALSHDGHCAREVRGSRAAVVGGSIAGLACARALAQLGVRVTVLERSQESAFLCRGSGVAAPAALLSELVSRGFLPPSYPCTSLDTRLWLERGAVGSADEAGAGRTLLKQDLHGSGPRGQDWSILWRSLRSQLPSDVEVRFGAEVERVCVLHGGGASVALASCGGASGGEELRVDVVFGADGYRSLVRSAMYPDLRPSFAGYVAWRGNYPERAAQPGAVALLDQFGGSFLTALYEGGHAIIYMVPDGAAPRAEHEQSPAGGAGAGFARRVNWVLYSEPPRGADFSQAQSVPQGGVTENMYAQLQAVIARLPASWRPLVAASARADVSIQPVYDLVVPSYVDAGSTLALAGDAGTVARPHTAAGSSKAIQDAMVLQACGTEHSTWPALLRAYDEERAGAGRDLVALGKSMGDYLVLRAPTWPLVKNEHEMLQILKRAMAGHRTYLLKRGSTEEESSQPSS